MRRELSSLLLLLAAAGAIDFDSFFGSQGFQGAQAGGSRGSSGGAADREYYDLLGVEPGCSEADLKKAWRKTSLQSHPDRGGDAEHFKKLNEAYQVLSDPQKRQLYDQYGKAGVEGGAGGMPGGFGGMGGGFGGPGGGFGGFSGMGGQGVDLDDVLNAFFGGGARSGGFGGGGFGGMRGSPRARTSVHRLSVTLEELYAGAVKQLTIEIGGRRVQKELHIRPGMASGQKFQFRDIAGFQVQLEQAPHRTWKREGDDLHAVVSLSLCEALGGFCRQLRQVDGSPVWLRPSPADAPTRPGQVRMLRGLGMPRYRLGGKGDMLLHFRVRFPERPISADAVAALRKALPRNAATESPLPGARQRVLELVDVGDEADSFFDE